LMNIELLLVLKLIFLERTQLIFSIFAALSTAHRVLGILLPVSFIIFYLLSVLSNNKNLIKFDNIKTEVKFSNSTRFDFLISNSEEKCFLEVKNVTLLRNKKIAEFPDAITSRGTKHLVELINAKKKGFQSCILYLIQRQDCKAFKIAEDIDINYKIAFDKAIKAGVKILCYDCKINDEEVKLNNQIELV